MPWSKDIRALEQGTYTPRTHADRGASAPGSLGAQQLRLGGLAQSSHGLHPHGFGDGVLEALARVQHHDALPHHPQGRASSRSLESSASSVSLMSVRSCTKGSITSHTSRSSSTVRAWAQERAGRGPPPLPASMKCALCGGILSDPVSTCDGAAYDRRCIETWFAGGNRSSPTTREPLESLELRPNPALQAAVADYLQLHELSERERKQWVDFVGELQSRMARKLERKTQQVLALRSTLQTPRRPTVGIVPGQVPGRLPPPVGACDATAETQSTSASTEEDKLSEQWSDSQEGLPFAPGPAPRHRASPSSSPPLTLLGRLKAGAWKE